MATILVVDDELGIRALLSEILADEGHAVELAENAAQARAVRERLQPGQRRQRAAGAAARQALQVLAQHQERQDRGAPPEAAEEFNGH